ncbi:MAG: polyhydroxyalkanoate synthesis repressor PhaR [Pseudomonadales bacterium]|nr:polyhydroxyalkanoate synthesis repressor PhaR [Pseudomonadales bacterium]
MREFKKYPNRRLYDIQESRYVTVEDIHKIILTGETISVLDSKSAKDLTRSVLLQIITEQEGAGDEPILTDKVLERLIQFYGIPMQRVVSQYIEQSVDTFIDHFEAYQYKVGDVASDVASSEPRGLMSQVLEQNMDFWNGMVNSTLRVSSPDGELED